jgi:hypothetical protein
MSYDAEQYEDRELTCAEGQPHTFTWTARDQAFYAEKGFTPPKRCREHAQARRAFFDAHPEKAQSKGRKQKHDRGDRDMLGE